MAKQITAKIRVGEYSSSENSFEIKFQLRPAFDVGPEFTFTFGPMLLVIPDDARFWLVGLGLSDHQIEQAHEEVLAWLHKFRTHLGGSWFDLLHGRVELAIKIENERHPEAITERIAVEAPCLNSAMPVTQELIEELIACPLPNEDSSTNTAARRPIEATIDPTAVMKAVGLGEEPQIIHIEVAETLPDHDDASSLAEADQSGLKEIKLKAGVHSELAFSPPRLPTAAIDNAVEEIHVHMRRFLDGRMSMREHNFIRGIIEEEIVKVVCGVL